MHIPCRNRNQLTKGLICQPHGKQFIIPDITAKAKENGNSLQEKRSQEKHNSYDLIHSSFLLHLWLLCMFLFYFFSSVNSSFLIALVSISSVI